MVIMSAALSTTASLIVPQLLAEIEHGGSNFDERVRLAEARAKAWNGRVRTIRDGVGRPTESPAVRMSTRRMSIRTNRGEHLGEPSWVAARMRMARPAEHLVHGINGPVVVIEGRVCVALNKLLGLDKIRGQIRGQNPDLDQALLAIRLAAIAVESSSTGTDVAAPTGTSVTVKPTTEQHGWYDHCSGDPRT